MLLKVRLCVPGHYRQVQFLGTHENTVLTSIAYRHTYKMAKQHPRVRKEREEEEQRQRQLRVNKMGRNNDDLFEEGSEFEEDDGMQMCKKNPTIGLR